MCRPLAPLSQRACRSATVTDLLTGGFLRPPFGKQLSGLVIDMLAHSWHGVVLARVVHKTA